MQKGSAGAKCVAGKIKDGKNQSGKRNTKDQSGNCGFICIDSHTADGSVGHKFLIEKNGTGQKYK